MDRRVSEADPRPHGARGAPVHRERAAAGAHRHRNRAVILDLSSSRDLLLALLPELVLTAWSLVLLLLIAWRHRTAADLRFAGCVTLAALASTAGAVWWLWWHAARAAPTPLAAMIAVDDFRFVTDWLFLGAFASGFLLYGSAFVSGATWTPGLRAIAAQVGAGAGGGGGGGTMLAIGLALLLIGFGFKVAAVPFHMWVPDVYDGSPTPVTAYMASGVKAAAFAALFRVLGEAFSAVAAWHEIVWWLAVATMVVGNLIALAQRAVKRMLAYSSVAHAGYLLVAVAAGPGPGSAAFLFYLVAYTLMTFGAFALLAAKGRQGERDVLIDDLAGLATRHPWLAFALAVCMLSLLGFPGTAGFIGKWYILAAATSAGQGGLAAALVLTSVISAGYYLPVIMAMYMKPEPSAEAHVGMRLGRLGYAVVTVCVAGLLFFGVRPNRLLDLARTGGVAGPPAPEAIPAAPAVSAAHAPTAR